MKTVLLVNVSSVWISNETCQPVTLTENERLLDNISGEGKYSFVEIYKPIKKFTGKTYKALDEQISHFSNKHKIYDFQSIIIKQ